MNATEILERIGTAGVEAAIAELQKIIDEIRAESFQDGHDAGVVKGWADSAGLNAEADCAD